MSRLALTRSTTIFGGEKHATSGQQCFSVTGLASGVLSWTTTWTWEGDTSVKSYANAALTSLSTSAKQISSISSVESKWSWTNKGSNVVADVAYDLFTSSSAGGDSEFEIMIWLAALGGAAPISSKYVSTTYSIDVSQILISTGRRW